MNVEVKKFLSMSHMGGSFVVHIPEVLADIRWLLVRSCCLRADRVLARRHITSYSCGVYHEVDPVKVVTYVNYAAVEKRRVSTRILQERSVQMFPAFVLGFEQLLGAMLRRRELHKLYRAYAKFNMDAGSREFQEHLNAQVARVAYKIHLFDDVEDVYNMSSGNTRSAEGDALALCVDNDGCAIQGVGVISLRDMILLRAITTGVAADVPTDDRSVSNIEVVRAAGNVGEYLEAVLDEMPSSTISIVV